MISSRSTRFVVSLIEIPTWVSSTTRKFIPYLWNSEATKSAEVKPEALASIIKVSKWLVLSVTIFKSSF